MSKIFYGITVGILIVHGLIHLMGTVTYLRLGSVEGLTYKTTLFNGRWDVGQTGMAVFGALWAVAAIGFVIAAIGLIAGWSWSQPMLICVTILSLVLTALDWNTAFAGVILNIVILIAVWLGPRLSGWIS
ncbi:MAG: hypothetical protein R3307_07930 [Anaerolineales bacterium]|nr:hypothetical protein [Anaerolineales bacterium]